VPSKNSSPAANTLNFKNSSRTERVLMRSASVIKIEPPRFRITHKVLLIEEQRSRHDQKLLKNKQTVKTQEGKLSD
jgi:hypothetical protein